MIIKPRFRGFICVTAHPEGCAAKVQEQIDYVKKQASFKGPKNVLVVGASAGYGLASRIALTFGAGAKTLGVFLEKPASDNKPASAGWYNSAAFEKKALQEGFYAACINGDAFSRETKAQTIKKIKEDLGQVDLVVYSLAAPRRTHPDSGEVISSVLKPIGRPFTGKTVDFHTGEVSEVTIQPAEDREIDSTVAVMGGEDWSMWMDALREEGVLAKEAITVAYSYIGPEITNPIYRDGTIGRAKDHLEKTAHILCESLRPLDGRAIVSVNKALVTQSSAAIPVVPLYVSILLKVMREKEIDEGCIEQMYRCFSQGMYGSELSTDDKGRLRLDDWEMRPDVQEEVLKIWEGVNTDNIYECTDLKRFREEFFALFGFGLPQVDYEEETDVEISIPSLQ
jgi:enoyl-[acyl-carrier protein] reductase/trans-2-enoyl-CoA reductase (NAD+)